MNILKEQYEDVVKRREKLMEEISELSNDETVKKYFKLCQKNNVLISRENELYEQIKNEEYSHCNHIWVRLLKDYDSYEGRTDIYCGCMKCGLDEKVIYKMEYNWNY